MSDDFMQLFVYDKAETWTTECAQCGATLWLHPDTTSDGLGAALEQARAGTLECDQCARGTNDPATLHRKRDHYAGRYSAPGYMDCTDWLYGTNLRALKKDLRDYYYYG